MVYVLRKFEPKMLVNALEQANRALASQIKPSDESIAKIVIPGWRYDQLAECVLKMYEDANANVMPLDVFSIAISIWNSPHTKAAYSIGKHQSHCLHKYDS